MNVVRSRWSLRSWTHHVMRGVIGVAVLVSLGACGGLLKSNASPQQIYVLHAASAVAATSGTATVSVLKPLTQPGLLTARIALTRPGNRLDYFADSRWSAGLPEVLQTFAEQSLQSSGRFASVVIDNGATRTDLELLLTIRNFEAEYVSEGGVPRAHVAFDCLLVARQPRATLGRCDSEAMVPAEANRMGGIVAALEKAAQQAMAGVVEKSAALIVK
jgi:ABC-type uncharacterized transport system auxiliary subunit